ncbi:MAG: hypothetical protein Ct9H300mP27_09060 [Chloroflexota bacterium]|nr:MAG: hypothetical protein Ct9H300mP27_09060 [Chloroflexota bacterium]
MIQRAGIPEIAADYDQRVVNEIFPAMASRAREMQAQPLPDEPTPNLVPN